MVTPQVNAEEIAAIIRAAKVGLQRGTLPTHDDIAARTGVEKLSTMLKGVTINLVES